MLNSIYGAFGNPYFYFFNVDIAETITLQGKDAILYTEKLINYYFKEFWIKDPRSKLRGILKEIFIYNLPSPLLAKEGN